MAYDPDLVVWGGDLAYANGQQRNLHRWIAWFKANDHTLIHDDGRIVPIVLGIGNHEVRGGYYYNHDDFADTDEWRLSVAPYFYQFFAFPGQPGYAALDFADYMSLIALDTDHTNTIPGPQSQWLEQALAQRTDVPHVFPFYHVPGHPLRGFDNPLAQRIREHWASLFDQYGLEIAFENHAHIYKRTVPLRAGEPHAAGIVYIGDGAWGVGTGHVGPGAADAAPHIAEAAGVRHAVIMTLHGRARHFLAVDEHGQVIDEYPRTPPRP